MPGTMSRADLVDDFKASLHDAADVFTSAGGADFSRLLNVAAADFARARPRTVVGIVQLSVGVADYAVPEDFYRYKVDLWADPSRIGRPWDKAYPGRLPSIRVAEISGVKRLIFSPAPNSLQIGVLGAEFRFYYFAKHVIGETDAGTSIDSGDRSLLILRAQAEAMREMAMRSLGKPVTLRDGLSGTPRNGTPAALYQALLGEFNEVLAS